MSMLSSLNSKRLMQRLPSFRDVRKLQGIERASVEGLESRTLFASYAPVNVAGLIAAINAANLTSEADTISLLAHKAFTMNAVNNTTDGPNGLPVLAAGENLTILGNSAIIERSAAPNIPAFRLFDVPKGASLTLENLTVQGGEVATFSLDPAKGGAIRSQGTLTMESTSVRNSIAKGVTVNVWGGELACIDAEGGGVWSSGTLTMTDCIVDNNRAVGGIGTNGSLYDSDSGEEGYSDPGGYGEGGGVFVAGGTAVINSSTLTRNIARGGNGGDGAGYGRNPAGAGGVGLGGGLYAALGQITLRKDTMTGNVADGGAGGAPRQNHPRGTNGDGSGGGIYNASATVGLGLFTVQNIRGNTATTLAGNKFGSFQLLS